jgi:hypothetical protein
MPHSCARIQHAGAVTSCLTVACDIRSLEHSFVSIQMAQDKCGEVLT